MLIASSTNVHFDMHIGSIQGVLNYGVFVRPEKLTVGDLSVEEI